MAPKNKLNLKDYFEDGEIDLSLSDLEDVPVREIVALKKATSLDLSNNRLTSLGNNFILLTNIIKLDLSKNLLTELPENFGELKQLKHLDLYNNKLTYLPLSFYQLKSLKWLDLKNNPLVPAVEKVAGPCLDNQQCTKCAKNIVQFYTDLYDKILVEKEQRNLLRKAELEVEAENLKKQQKKKEKNKALKAKKNKMKAERKHEMRKTSLETFSSVEELAMKNGKKYPARPTKKESCLYSFTKILFCNLITLSIFLFVFTSLKTNFSQNVREKFTDAYYNMVENYVSEDYLPYFETFTLYFGSIHASTGAFLETVAENANEFRKSDTVKELQIFFLQAIDVIKEKLMELLRKFGYYLFRAE